jgi:hypothetical protein
MLRSNQSKTHMPRARALMHMSCTVYVCPISNMQPLTFPPSSASTNGFRPALPLTHSLRAAFRFASRRTSRTRRSRSTCHSKAYIYCSRPVLILLTAIPINDHCTRTDIDFVSCIRPYGLKACITKMSARLPAQDAARLRGPQAAPETPRKQGDGAAIDVLARELRDELGVAIAPRDLLYSPSHHTTQADTLYNRIKTLYWKERVALYAAIEECKSDFAGRLSTLSPERRTDLVLQRLDDPAWFASNRVHQPLLRASSTLTRTASDPRPKQRLFQRVDSKIETPSPSTPTSPLARKTMAENVDDSQTNARDSFWSRGSSGSNDTTANTSLANNFTNDEGFYGSSIPFSQVEDPTTGTNFRIDEGHMTRSITPHPEAASTIDQAQEI